MRFKNSDRGVAGLTILLSLVTMLFVIGLLVMIFSLMGGELKDATYDSTTATVTNESVTGLAVAGDLLTYSTLTNSVCSAVTIWNMSDSVTILTTGNYTMNNCNVTGIAASPFLTFNLGVNYTYTYDASNTATRVMNDTTASISTVTDWFNIFIVIAAMVVLILLTVIIIVAIRGSGLMTGSA